MEISGKIIAVMPANSGVSTRTGNSWMSQEYVIETHDQYPRKCCFRIFGEDKIKRFDIKVGEELTVSVDIDAREYKGRWYNDISAWNVSRQFAGSQEPAQTPFSAPVNAEQTSAPASSAANSDDDLPF